MKFTQKLLKRTIKEELEKLQFYKKYKYGIDDIPDASSAEDDIIGHT